MNRFGCVVLAAFLSCAVGALAGCAVVPAGPGTTVAAAPVYVAPAPVYVAPGPVFVGPGYWHGGCCDAHWRR